MRWWCIGELRCQLEGVGDPALPGLGVEPNDLLLRQLQTDLDLLLSFTRVRLGLFLLKQLELPVPTVGKAFVVIVGRSWVSS